MKCLACLNDTSFLFRHQVMSKYLVTYFQCPSCGFIQTESPYWLEEAYKKAITSTDIGLLSRNLYLSNIVFDLVINLFDTEKKFLDFGGGYGVLVRLLRDKGLDFYRQDIYCENIFAVNHDIKDLDINERKFDLVTCFEVLEHTCEPDKVIASIQNYTDNILFSTILIPGRNIRSADDWWYFAPETGQHISFYTEKALKYLAQRSNMNLYTNGVNLHLFTRRKLNENPFKIKKNLKVKLTNALISFLQKSNSKKLASLVEHDLTIAKRKSAGI